MAFIVEQRDGTLAHLPVWMAEPEAARCRIVSQPRIALAALLDLRRLADAALSSAAAEAPNGEIHERGETKAAESLKRDAVRSPSKTGPGRGIRTADPTSSERFIRTRGRKSQ
jgi:hypothetical protein